ncbi:MAG: alkaline shock response membrane anchor protein AmaP [Candidatus Omnitrophica bacterium]|nr:alkaline shock response membrane anchor protein AmaP [Candidatus Omnitrophota bacterium]MCM8827999.1 alkaline shock response membrane anchor protein AmaP [Candidatus Omnitrophota bacterium]
MRIFTRIVQAIFILSGVTLVLFLALCWIKPELLIKASHYIETNLLKAGLAGFSLILVIIIWFVYWIDYVIRTKNICLDNPHGKVRISLRAIEEFISTKISAQMPNIKSILVKASIGSHGLETLIQMRISGGYNIPEFTSQIQELIRNYLEDVVGVERVSHIEIFVTSIAPAPVEEKDEEGEKESN